MPERVLVRAIAQRHVCRPRLRRQRRNITFRLELFNALNHPNWGNPDMSITNTLTVGSINRVTVSARQAQFALRFDF